MAMVIYTCALVITIYKIPHIIIKSNLWNTNKKYFLHCTINNNIKNLVVLSEKSTHAISYALKFQFQHAKVFNLFVTHLQLG